MMNLGLLKFIDGIDETDYKVSTKVCLYCKCDLPLSFFPKHSLYKDKLDTRCKACIKDQSKTRNKLHKIAPPKPNVCECCGNIPRNDAWRLDHDHNTKKIRGWICDQCNTGLGKLGDNIEGLKKALDYLKKCNKKG
jgi:hypothetical protein